METNVGNNEVKSRKLLTEATQLSQDNKDTLKNII